MPEVSYIGLPALEARAIAALTEGVGKAAHDLEGRAKGILEGHVDTGTLLGSVHVDGPSGGAGGVEARVVQDTMLLVRTLEGQMQAIPGDWIIRGVAGEFYPCKPDIFAATYDPVEAPVDPA